MKKKIIFFLTVLALTTVLLALAVSAGDVISYTDYSKEGANGEAPIFTFLGYSMNEDETDICVEYLVNISALEAFEESSGIKLEYGVVAVAAEYLDGKTPLDSKTAKPIDISSRGATVGKYIQSNVKSSILSLVITNISEENKEKELFVCMYAFDGNEVWYFSSPSATAVPKPISYSSVLGPQEVVYTEGNDKIVYSYEKPESTVANDRSKQMQRSEQEYGTPVIDANTYTSSRISEILKAANIIAGKGSGWDIITALGARAAFPNASRFMEHYLKNTGADYKIDMGTGTTGFFKSGAGTLTHRVNRVEQAIRAAEILAKEGKSVSIYQQNEQVNHFSDTEDWYLAVGSYFTCIEMNNVTVTVNENGIKTYLAELTYTVSDFYNWNENSWTNVPIVNVTQRDLHQLHRLEKAKEFESSGSVTYSITWTEGQSASELSFK